MHIIVEKRNGSKEPFDMDKIARVMKAAGLTDEQITMITDQMNQWVKNLQEKNISSLKIRDKILGILPDIDQTSADLYSWYQKTKER